MVFSAEAAQTAAVTAPSAPVSAPAPAPVPPSAPPAAARFEAKVRAADSVTLAANDTLIGLWAVQQPDGMGPSFNIRARTTLDNAVGQDKITCETKSRAGNRLFAQCVNRQDQDLSLFMIQQGFVTVDRAAVFGTVFEDAYMQAEMQAQNRNLGLWADEGAGGGKGESRDGVFMMSFGFILFLCILAAFTVLSIIIMRGFQKVIDAQNQNVEMMSRERKLRDRERAVVAIMLDSELKANKAKIEAYCVVYEEMLRSLKEQGRTPKYKKAGDIIQRQPALGRAVFDRNTDKIDMLGGRLSSELIHFYARIKSSPDYINLEPATPVEEAVAMVEKAVGNAKRLDELAERLLESFAGSGITSENFE